MPIERAEQEREPDDRERDPGDVEPVTPHELRGCGARPGTPGQVLEDDALREERPADEQPHADGNADDRELERNDDDDDHHQAGDDRADAPS